jgi:uncharacterized protein YycO
MIKLPKAIINLLSPITTFVAKNIGPLHLPFTHKEIKDENYYNILKLIEPGSILLSYTHGEMTNLLIPSGPYKFTHAAIYLPGLEHPYTHETIVESTGKGVSISSLVQFLMTKDEVMILKPNYPDILPLSDSIHLANETLGKPYDFAFNNPKAFYCSELVHFLLLGRQPKDIFLPCDFIKDSTILYRTQCSKP